MCRIKRSVEASSAAAAHEAAQAAAKERQTRKSIGGVSPEQMSELARLKVSQFAHLSLTLDKRSQFQRNCLARSGFLLIELDLIAKAHCGELKSLPLKDPA